MADLFELDAETLATVENGIDSLIHQLGKDCKLIFEGDKQVCNNCIFDSANNRSSNKYNGVGPTPFTTGKCPVCKGAGFLPGTQTTVDYAKFLIDWQPKPWNFVDPNAGIKVPQGLVQTKGFVADLPKVLQAKYLVVDYTNATLIQNKFVRWGEPVLQGNIVKSKYFICFWQRYGG